MAALLYNLLGHEDEEFPRPEALFDQCSHPPCLDGHDSATSDILDENLIALSGFPGSLDKLG
jgi:hypothetical protein